MSSTEWIPREVESTRCRGLFVGTARRTSKLASQAVWWNFSRGWGSARYATTEWKGEDNSNILVRVGIKLCPHQNEYLIKWKNAAAESWEPELNIDRKLVVDFERARGEAKTHIQLKKGRKFSPVVNDLTTDWTVHFRRSQTQPKEVTSPDKEGVQKTRQKRAY